ncbi:MAG: hypothetical protein WC867_05560 [Candidatus Pacearchaeota archaeon]|jgi:hypothetical protein
MKNKYLFIGASIVSGIFLTIGMLYGLTLFHCIDGSCLTDLLNKVYFYPVYFLIFTYFSYKLLGKIKI